MSIQRVFCLFLFTESVVFTVFFLTDVECYRSWSLNHFFSIFIRGFVCPFYFYTMFLWRIPIRLVFTSILFIVNMVNCNTDVYYTQQLIAKNESDNIAVHSFMPIYAKAEAMHTSLCNQRHTIALLHCVIEYTDLENKHQLRLNRKFMRIIW